MISIIIPTYNRAHLIGETLNSIIAQTYTSWECIIVDDGSTDTTEQIITDLIKKDNRFQYYKRPLEKTKGANSCRNYGFELSKGEYVNWIDSDDLYKSNALMVLSNSFAENIDVIVSKLELIDFEKKIKIRESSIRSTNLIEDYYQNNVGFYVCGPVWKRNFLLKQKILFDELISNLDDWDFNLRMLYQNTNINYLDEPLIQYRVHEASLSNEIGKLNFQEIQSEFKAIRKHLLLIEQNKKANPKVLKIHLKNRHKFILRAALVENNKYKLYYLKELLILEFQLFQFLEMIKTILGFTIYSIFKKGYKLL
jgi:glycosyltransferase involved in cell wall biosynthesis